MRLFFRKYRFGHYNTGNSRTKTLGQVYEQGRLLFMPDDWLIRRTKPYATHLGRAIPAFFFYNGDYYLGTIDAYADGAVNYGDLRSFKSRVNSGWIVTKPPEGKVVFVGNLGFATVAEQRWILEPDDI